MVARQQEDRPRARAFAQHLRGLGPPGTARIRLVEQIAGAEDGIGGMSVREVEDPLEHLQARAAELERAFVREAAELSARGASPPCARASA